MLFAGALTFALCIWAGNLFDLITLPKYIFEFTKIVCVGSLCFITYTVLNLILKMDYAKELTNRIKIFR